MATVKTIYRWICGCEAEETRDGRHLISTRICDCHHRRHGLVTIDQLISRGVIDKPRGGITG
jgi:hypothetical protein